MFLNSFLYDVENSEFVIDYTVSLDEIDKIFTNKKIVDKICALEKDRELIMSFATTKLFIAVGLKETIVKIPHGFITRCFTVTEQPLIESFKTKHLN